MPDALLNTFMQSGATVANLRAFPGIGVMTVWLVGTNAPSDGGQGTFIWNATATTADDDGASVVAPNGLLAGRWLRQSGSGAQIFGVPNIAALRALGTGISPVWVEGYYAAGDGGGGLYMIGTPASDNGGSIIVSADGTYYLNSLTNSYNWRQFGAKGDGTTDDTTALNACIAACGVAGFNCLGSVGDFKITSSLVIGNGTASAVSTTSGVKIIGSGQPVFPPQFSVGFSLTGPTTVTWAGGASPMILVSGPIQGWGVQNLVMNGASLATAAISVVSGQYGDCRNLSIYGCVNSAIAIATVAVFSAGVLCDSIHNKWVNVMIGVPQVANAKGITLSGNTTNVTSNTDYNDFENVFIALPGAGNCYGVYLQNCDSNTFRNLHLGGGGASANLILFDYSASAGSVWPSANSFYAVDTGANAGSVQFSNAGTPGAGARPNYLYGLDQANGATNSNIANLVPSLPARTPVVVSLASQSAAIGATPIYTPFAGQVFRVSIYLFVAATGNNQTVSVTISWDDGVSLQNATTTALNVSAPGQISQTYAFENIAGVSFNYTTNLSGSLGSGAYSLVIVAETIG